VPTSSVTIEEQRLVLRNVDKSHSGQYVCSASNVEGDGFSKPLLVVVNYRPVCVAPAIEYRSSSSASSSSAKMGFGGQNEAAVGPHQEIDLKCQVDAKPISKVGQFNANNALCYHTAVP
jgi:hypothetical protein